jgi:putative nucleotidyltransferase with HDIG domain
MEKLDKYIDELKTLPPAPQVLSQLLVHLNSKEVHADEIIELISLDPALTARVLQRCNSAAFGLSWSVSGLDEGVRHLGFDAVYQLVAMVVGEGILGAEQKGYGLGPGDLWEHSVTTAVAARVIAQNYQGNENLVFTAGLLHDIGKLVLGTFLEKSRQSVAAKTGTARLGLLDLEKSVLGVDHAEVGGRLLARWSFPENLVRSVRFHHNPFRARPDEQLAAYVHLGDILAHCLAQAKGFDAFAAEARPEAMQILGVRRAEIEPLLLEAEAALKQCRGFIRST